MIKEIIETLDAISANKDDQPLYVLGGYIVGCTIVRDDIDELYAQYPELETIAELGADLETLTDDTLAELVFKEFQDTLIHFKESIGEG